MAGIARMIADARVGGDYWRKPIADGPPATVIRARSLREATRIVRSTECDAGPVVVSLPTGLAPAFVEPFLPPSNAVVTGPADPWSLLARAKRVVAPLGDELAVLGALAGVDVAYSLEGPVLARSSAARVAAQDLIAGFDYFDPFSGERIAIERWIAILAEWRQQIDANRGIAAVWGIAAWKRPAIEAMLWDGRRRRLHGQLRQGARPGKDVAIWPSRVKAERVARAEASGSRIVRIEDGFLRSNGLGCHLHPPQSITVDPVGIYYDPTRPSRLEQILAETEFDPALIERAGLLIDRIVSSRIGKYGRDDGAAPPRPAGRRYVLVAGQVEDDLSVQLGGRGAHNLDLLISARAVEPDAYIVYKPHPDVVAGLRRGSIAERIARHFADAVVSNVSIAALLDEVDAIHVLTSLAGFEALLRGREVVTHGHPFYAGWGLTRDLAPAIPRRGRRLSREELVAGALILYPRYLDPETGLPCPPEVLVERQARLGQPRPTVLNRLRAMQGRFQRPLQRVAELPA